VFETAAEFVFQIQTSDDPTYDAGRLPGERVHLWVLTHHPGSPQRWGGFDDLDAVELAEVRRVLLLSVKIWSFGI
jgi:hypothetical protein